MRLTEGGRFCCALMAALMLAAGMASADTLDHIRQDKTIRVAYRDDAPPFSFKGKTEPLGYMVDLCRAVAKNLAQQLNLRSLNIDYVKVTAADRFDAITQGKADLLCEPTTQTLSRREKVDFSIPTFVDGAGLLIRRDGPKSLKALGGRKVAVLAGTTTEQELNGSLKAADITAEVIPARTHDEGLKMLDDGKISAYFADHTILLFLAGKSKSPSKFMISDDYLSIEPYALALPHGDEDFRLAVDRALSNIYRSGEIAKIYTHTFGNKTKPSQTLQSLYVISALPE
jgi:ABC-type amino acid transport substrate-binding protein